MTVSLVEEKREKINGCHDIIYSLPNTFQKCDDILETVNSALSKETTLTHTSIAHTAMEESPLSEEFLANDSDREGQAALQRFKFPALSSTYERDGALIRQAPLDAARQKDVPVALHTCLLYLSHYTTLAGHSSARKIYDTMRHPFSRPEMANDVIRH